MIAVNNPTIESPIPTVAALLFSERLPNTPNTIPRAPRITPKIGMTPPHKLKRPNAAEASA